MIIMHAGDQVEDDDGRVIAIAQRNFGGTFWEGTDFIWPNGPPSTAEKAAVSRELVRRRSDAIKYEFKTDWVV